MTCAIVIIAILYHRRAVDYTSANISRQFARNPPGLQCNVDSIWIQDFGGVIVHNNQQHRLIIPKSNEKQKHCVKPLLEHHRIATKRVFLIDKICGLKNIDKIRGLKNRAVPKAPVALGLANKCQRHLRSSSTYSVSRN